jgi:HPt (histidine-containing phosphotransfer) domain-containing protein
METSRSAVAATSHDHRQNDTSAPWPIDLIHLRRFTLGDQQLEHEVLGLFAGELPKTLQSLRQAETDRAWHIAAHTLKGSARAVGAWRLARAAQVAEHHPITAGAEASAKALASVESAIAEAQDFVRQLTRAM